jgi:transketolase
MSGVAMRDVWGEKLVELGTADHRTVVLDGDLANSTKADKFAKAHPDRFFQMGIAEQNLIGAAAGLASMGFVPWTSSFTVFFTHRALDPIRMLVAQSHANVKIVGSYSGLLIGAVGKTHLDVQDLAIMRAMPDVTVLAPADATELVAMMDWAQAYAGPVYLRLVRDAVPDLFGDDYTFSPGAIRVVRNGGDSPEVAFVSTGAQSTRVLAAAEQLAASGVQSTVIHAPSLKPFDSEALVAAVGATPLVVTVEEHSVIGGLGGLIAETLGSAGIGARIVRFGLDDVWGESADNEFLLDKHGLSATRIAERVTGLVPARAAR